MRAAVEVMGEDGYEGASIRDMAARADVSVAALYYHFPSKLDLLREFLDEAYDVTMARIERRLASAGDKPAARLDVIDNGCGVPDALRESLFLPLVSGRANGTGLGLALAQEIAREHGGAVTHASRPGQTVFSLVVPLGGEHG